MARNQKYQSAAIRFGPALKATLLCLFIGGSGIGYVWQRNQIDQLGQQIKKRELRLSELKRQNQLSHDALALLLTPTRLQVEAQKLGLGAPQQKQIQTLREPLPVPAAGEPRLAAWPRRADAVP